MFREVSSTVLTSTSVQIDGQTSKAVSSPETAALESPPSTFRTTTTEVQVSVDVRQGRRAVEGLRADDFVVKDNGKPQTILTLTHDSTPLDIVLLLDVSGSVRPYLPSMASISRRALAKLGPTDKVAVMVFSREALVVEGFTTDAHLIQAAIEKASKREPPGSGTRIYSAIAQAARYIGAQNPTVLRRRAVLVVTDNSGLSYNVNQERVLRSLYDANATLDALVIGRHPHPPPPRAGSVINPEFAFDDVFPLADRTGGEAIATSKPKNSLSTVLDHMRDRYLLLYRAPAAVVPGSFRTIRVELSPAAKQRLPQAAVTARDGYYVSGPAAQPEFAPE